MLLSPSNRTKANEPTELTRSIERRLSWPARQPAAAGLSAFWHVLLVVPALASCRLRASAVPECESVTHSVPFSCLVCASPDVRWHICTRDLLPGASLGDSQ